MRHGILPVKSRPFWDLRAKQSRVGGHTGHSGDRNSWWAKGAEDKLDLLHKSV